MHPQALEFQEAVLELARKEAETETFLRHISRHVLEFEGERSFTSQASQTELSVRILKNGREGLAAQATFHPCCSAKELVELAGSTSLTGRKLATLRANPPSAVPRPGKAPSFSPTALPDSLNDLTDSLRSALPDCKWSGTISHRTTTTRICNDAGLDVQGQSSLWQVQVRARSFTNGLVRDWTVTVEAESWPAVMALLSTRLSLELFPLVRGHCDHLPNLVILGPVLVADILSAIAARSSLRRGTEIDSNITVMDQGIPCGFDDEGIASVPLSFIQDGIIAPPWTMLGQGERPTSPTGRAVRIRIERPPRLQASSLLWSSRLVEWPKRAVFVPELAAAMLRDDGTLVGNPVQAVIFEEGRPTGLLPVSQVSFSISEVLGHKFVGATFGLTGVRSHNVPPIIVEMSLSV